MNEETLLTGRHLDLRGRLWRGTEDRGVVIVVHGLGDHSGRYQELAAGLTPHGWQVFAFDLPGHGHSPGQRGVADRYHGLLADIDAARGTVAQTTRSPQVLLGHSMGGNLVLNYALRRNSFPNGQAALAGMVLSAPMLLPPKPPPRPQIFAAWLTGKLFPWVRIKQRVDVDKLTADAERAKALRSDSLMHSKISLYLATQLLAQGRWALDHAREVDVATLILFGQQDELIDLSACQHVAVRIGHQATLESWPEARHELFHDRSRDRVTERLVKWLERQVASRGDEVGDEA